MKSGNCLNCESALESHHHFCPNCGQKTDLHRFSLHEISHETLHYFTHADKGFFQLLKSLLIHTGKVGREYVAYFSVYYYRFINKRTMPSLFKAIGVSAFATIFWTALTSFLIGIYISNGFWGLVR